jgi:hypothetical protein
VNQGKSFLQETQDMCFLWVTIVETMLPFLVSYGSAAVGRAPEYPFFGTTSPFCGGRLPTIDEFHSVANSSDF